MRVLLLAPIIFCLAFIIHLAIWKFRLPENQKRILLKIFLDSFFICLAGIWFASKFIASFEHILPDSFVEYFYLFIFYISVALSYMVTYSAIEVDSPSLIMIENIAKAGNGGLDKEQFDKSMNDELLVMPRIKDLIDDKIVYLASGKHKLTYKGILMARIFIFYRELLRINEKGG